jgi:hypothetical protein
VRAWACPSEKLQENFGQCGFFSAREVEHGRFRALFADGLGLVCRMGEFRPKTKKVFTTEGTEDNGGKERLTTDEH